MLLWESSGRRAWQPKSTYTRVHKATPWGRLPGRETSTVTPQTLALLRQRQNRKLHSRKYTRVKPPTGKEENGILYFDICLGVAPGVRGLEWVDEVYCVTHLGLGRASP